MRITKRTNLAMRVLMFCAVNAGRNVTKAEIAEGCNASPHHVGHVVYRLGHHGFLETLRGRRGGLRLARPAERITVGDVFRQLEADVPVTECFDGGENTCPLRPFCRLKPEIACALEAFYAHLDGVTLADLTEKNAGLHGLLAQSRPEPAL